MSRYPTIRIDDVRSIEIIEKRWMVRIRLILNDGKVREFIASADSADTDYSGIYFEELTEGAGL